MYINSSKTERRHCHVLEVCWLILLNSALVGSRPKDMAWIKATNVFAISPISEISPMSTYILKQRLLCWALIYMCSATTLQWQETHSAPFELLIWIVCQIMTGSSQYSSHLSLQINGNHEIHNDSLKTAWLYSLALQWSKIYKRNMSCIILYIYIHIKVSAAIRVRLNQLKHIAIFIERFGPIERISIIIMKYIS